MRLSTIAMWAFIIAVAIWHPIIIGACLIGLLIMALASKLDPGPAG